MKTEFKTNHLILGNGINISIGSRIDHVALISQHTCDFIPFTAIKKGGRLAKLKRKFKRNICSETHFFFDFMTKEDIAELAKAIK